MDCPHPVSHILYNKCLQDTAKKKKIKTMLETKFTGGTFHKKHHSLNGVPLFMSYIK